MPMRELYSIGPILEGIGLNVTAWSFRDKLSFSILCCHRAIPEPTEIQQGLVATMKTMREAARLHEPKTA